MGRLLEFAAALFFAWLWLSRLARTLRVDFFPRPAAPPPPSPPPAAPGPVSLVRCDACGVFVPEARAQREGGAAFCSETCRRQGAAAVVRPG